MYLFIKMIGCEIVAIIESGLVLYMMGLVALVTSLHSMH